MVTGRSAADLSLLAGSGLHGTACQDARQALAMLQEGQYQVVFCVFKAPGVDAMQLMGQVLEAFPTIAFVMITEPRDLRDGILAMISGASDYVCQPLAPDIVRASLERAQNRKRAECALKKHMGCPALPDDLQPLNVVVQSGKQSNIGPVLATI
jgi:DNA-binding NtrC family response regulator